MLAERDYANNLRVAAVEQLKIARQERDAARDEAAEYRTLVDRCRERNKELGLENTKLRDQMAELDPAYDDCPCDPTCVCACHGTSNEDNADVPF